MPRKTSPDAVSWPGATVLRNTTTHVARDRCNTGPYYVGGAGCCGHGLCGTLRGRSNQSAPGWGTHRSRVAGHTPLDSLIHTYETAPAATDEVEDVPWL